MLFRAFGVAETFVAYAWIAIVYHRYHYMRKLKFPLIFSLSFFLLGCVCGLSLSATAIINCVDANDVHTVFAIIFFISFFLLLGAWIVQDGFIIWRSLSMKPSKALNHSEEVSSLLDAESQSESSLYFDHILLERRVFFIWNFVTLICRVIIFIALFVFFGCMLVGIINVWDKNTPKRHSWMSFFAISEYLYMLFVLIFMGSTAYDMHKVYRMGTVSESRLSFRLNRSDQDDTSDGSDGVNFS